MGKKARKKALKSAEAYLRVLQPLMRLQHWQIAISDNLPDGDALAEVARMSHAQDAAIRLADGYPHLSPEQQRELLVHEMLHLYVRDMIGLPEMIKQEISLPLYAALRERTSHEEECMVDALAQLIAPFMPLPKGKRGD